MKKKKKPRTKALEFLLTSHDMHSNRVDASGWNFWQITEEMKLSLQPWFWPRIELAADQGPEVMESYFWLRVNKVNVGLSSDPNHGVLDDVKLAIQQNDCFTEVLLMMVVANLHQRPFESMKYYEKLHSAQMEYFAMCQVIFISV